MMYSTHASLLARVTDNVDPKAWAEFHDRYADLIRGFARRRGLQGSDCDDVVQDVLLALTKSMQSFEYKPELGKFRSYLKTITNRIILRKSSQKRGEATLGSMDEQAAESSDHAAVEQSWETEWRLYHIRTAMTRLESEFNEQDRLAFSQYAVAGRSVNEVACSTGLSVDQVYKAKSRILKRLSELIEGQIEDEG